MVPKKNFIPHHEPAEAAGGARKAALTKNLEYLPAVFLYFSELQ